MFSRQERASGSLGNSTPVWLSYYLSRCEYMEILFSWEGVGGFLGRGCRAASPHWEHHRGHSPLYLTILLKFYPEISYVPFMPPAAIGTKIVEVWGFLRNNFYMFEAQSVKGIQPLQSHHDPFGGHIKKELPYILFYFYSFPDSVDFLF